MEDKPGYKLLQYGVGTNPVTVPPAPGPPKGQVLPGLAAPTQWMSPPRTITGCPPGLEYLTKLDQILVHQQVELLEVITGIETQNKYKIKNALGQQIFYASEEESNICMRQCCGSKRGFTMNVVDNMNQEVLRVVRPFKCCSGYNWCAGCCIHCAYTLDVEAPPGQPIGHVRQRGSKWKPHFDILDVNLNPVLKIRGPCCFCQNACCTDDIEFRLMTPDDSEEIGKISKQWAGLAKEVYTKADNFGITFPVDLNAKVKATLLGALFLIDFMFFEQPKNHQGAARHY